MRWLHKHKASGDGAPTSTPWCGQQAEQSLVTQLVLLDWPRILFSILASSWRRGQVLLPPPSKPESSRDLPWSLHQAGFLWDHRAPAASLASVYGALPCCHDALCCGEHKDVSPHPPRGDLQEEGSREEEDQHSSSS
eukprot:XP_022276225.1 iron-sulfur cluster assembly 1 homolog, mitochondrial isoform X2 [Canis lupus familiaris]